MAKKKRDNRRGQRPGSQHNQPPKPIVAQTAAQLTISHPQAVVVNQPQAAQDRQVEASQKRDPDAEKYYRLELWQHRFTAALVLLAFGSAGIAIWQGRITNNQLAAMQQEQRPWLAGSPEPIAPLERMDELDRVLDLDERGVPIPDPEWSRKYFELANWKIRIRNVGTTPATIRWSHIEWHPATVAGKERPFDPVTAREQATKEARSKPARNTVIPPGDNLVFPMQDLNQAYSVVTDRLERRRQWSEARITGVFIYTDGNGGEHTTYCCFRRNRISRELENHLEDGYMD